MFNVRRVAVLALCTFCHVPGRLTLVMLLSLMALMLVERDSWLRGAVRLRRLSRLRHFPAQRCRPPFLATLPCVMYVSVILARWHGSNSGR